MAPARVFKHALGDGQVVHALLFQLPEGSPGVTAHDHLIFVDTSASQIGAHRLHGLKVLDSLLTSLPESDRVRLFAVDVEAEPLMPSFAEAHSEAVQAGVAALKTRIPLGATDLQAMIQSAVNSKHAERLCSIIYIGDGMSTADLLEINELGKMVTALKSQKISFHSYGVGPQINLQVLGILAHQTGGYIDFDNRIGTFDKENGQLQIAAEQGRKLGHAVQQPVLYPTQVNMMSDSTESLPLLPLRSDRETIYVVRGTLAANTKVVFSMDKPNPSLVWELSAPLEQPNLSFLAAIGQQAENDHGLNNPLAGRALMQACQKGFNDSIKESLRFGAEQLKLGRADEAADIAHRIADLDPSNHAAESLASAAEKLRVHLVSQITKVEEEVDTKTSQEAEGNPSLTRDLEQLIRVKTAKLQSQVGDAVSKSRTTDPESGLVLLKQARNAVVISNDIAPEDRAQFIRRLDNEIGQLKTTKDKVDQERVHLAERLSQLEAEKRLTEQFQLDEERLEGLIDRVRALMLEGKHGRDEAFGEAQNVADVAINLRPGEGTSAAARFDSEAAQQLNRAYRLRARRADQLLETLHQVELAHIPFPDEPPVRYPPAEVWRALSERRRKWSSVDLHRDSPREQKIQQELKNTTEVNFSDIPLKDALDYLQELHHIAIWPDNKLLSDEGISTDTPVSLVMTGVTLRSVLRLLLEPLLLTYVIEDEVLKITTQTSADEKMVTRVYPVADLVVPIVSPMQGGMMGGQRGGMGGGMMGGGMGGGMMGGGMGGMGGGMGGGFFSIPPEKISFTTKRHEHASNHRPGERAILTSP